MSAAGKPVLPPLSTDAVTAQLPKNPDDLLSGDEHRELDDDLARIARLRREAETACANLPLATVEYGLKYTEADGRVSYGVFANRAGAERTAAAISGRGWSTVRAEVEERDVSPWRPVKPAEDDAG